MSIDQFNRSGIPSKVRIIISDPDPKYVFGYLAYRLGENLDDLKQKFTITVNSIRQRIFIKGSYQDIASLFYELNRFGLKYESVQQSELRIDINHFFNRIK